MLQVVLNAMNGTRLASTETGATSVGPSMVSKVLTPHRLFDEIQCPGRLLNFLQPTNWFPSITRPTKTLAIMMLDHIAHTNEEFMALIKCQPWAYADCLVRSFFATVTVDTPEGDDSEICEQITKISEFINVVNKHEATILNAAGVGQELAEAHEYRDCMEEVQKWLEDILCGIMEGVDVLVETHKSRGLLYQNVIHTVT
ncbi:hypothetical protein EDD18DRAFT_1107856 [Armillaria luteobubalina]|uniref:Uncharacterized protein n=1 Tax=Armillaria luteobubalina TaxID=153913 RepID=A0AA39Q0K2_9AGAR|nr:hypothetical protein EDD18DRAFT_1107856 [Armillaria luteobubalina]